MIEFESCGHGIETACFRVGDNNDATDVKVIRPVIRTYPGEIKNEAIAINLGWTESPEHFRRLGREIAKKGSTAVIIKHAIECGFIDRILRAGEVRVESTITACRYLEEVYESYSLAGHSLGGIDSTRAIIEGDLKPEVLHLLGSAGLKKLDNFKTVSPRVLKGIFAEERNFKRHPISLARFATESLVTILKNPALTISEGRYAATRYVGRHIDDIADKGIVVCNSVAEEDVIFPYKDIIKDTEGLKIDILKIFRKATHNFPYTRPKEVADLIIETSANIEHILGTRVGTIGLTTADIEEELFMGSN